MNVLSRLDASQKWTQEESMLLDSVQQLAREKIAPRAAAYDKSGEFPWDNVQEINALGLNVAWRNVQYTDAF
jgi:alkylation response protein AidB-like acyl-CoA dehydrogenase